MSTVTAQTEFLSWRWNGGSVAVVLHSRITNGVFSPEILVQLAWALAFLKSSPGDVNVQAGRQAGLWKRHFPDSCYSKWGPRSGTTC